MHSMHGLFRGDNLELGRDEDIGGQILYVRYLSIELGKLPEVEKVDIVVRQSRVGNLKCPRRGIMKSIELYNNDGEGNVTMAEIAKK
jgi:hypothetical protein